MKTVFPQSIQNAPIAERLTAKLFGQFLERSYYKNFFNSIPSETSLDSGQRILMYVGISDMYLSPIEVLMYHLLKSKGVKVDYYVYGEEPLYNEITTQERIEKEGLDKFWKRSYRRGKQTLESSNVRYNELPTYPESEDIAAKLDGDLDSIFSFTLDGYDIGSIVKSVMYRYYRSLSFGKESELVAKEFLKTTLNNYFHTKKLLSENQYDFVMFSHGIYCTWQIVEQLCKNNGINYLCYDRAKTKGHANFTLNDLAPAWNMNDAWERVRDRTLTDSQNAAVDRYVKERESQKGDVFSFNPAPRSKDLAALKSSLNISPSAKVITVFTNLIWDAANVARDLAFSSPLDCIIGLSEVYQDKDLVHILVRSHPAEKIIGTHERYGALVAKHFEGKIPENITIVEPEMEVNSFNMIDISDVGIVHTSTVGIEIAMSGKPVILISETHYRRKGFTIDSTSKRSFFDGLTECLQKSKISDKERDLARNYFHLMMFEYQHKMPIEFTQQNRFNGYGYSSFSDLLKEEHRGLPRIIDSLLDSRSDFVFEERD